MLEILFERAGSKGFFIISIISIGVFYQIMRIILKKKFNLNIPIIPERYPNNPIINYIQPLILIVGMIVSLLLQIGVVYIIKADRIM